MDLGAQDHKKNLKSEQTWKIERSEGDIRILEMDSRFRGGLGTAQLCLCQCLFYLSPFLDLPFVFFFKLLYSSSYFLPHFCKLPNQTLSSDCPLCPILLDFFIDQRPKTVFFVLSDQCLTLCLRYGVQKDKLLDRIIFSTLILNIKT